MSCCRWLVGRCPRRLRFRRWFKIRYLSAPASFACVHRHGALHPLQTDEGEMSWKRCLSDNGSVREARGQGVGGAALGPGLGILLAHQHAPVG